MKKKRFIKITLILIFGFFILNSQTLAQDSSIKTGSELGSYFPAMREIFSELRTEINLQAKNFRKTDYQKANEELKIAEEFLTSSEQLYTLEQKEMAENALNSAVEYLKKARLNLTSSRSVELRGIYIDGDSIPKTKEGISELLKKLKKANINVIYPEVFRRGYSIIPTPFTETDPSFVNLDFDVLHHLTEEAKNQELEVHPWFWTFRVKSPKFGNPILGKYPHLAATGKNEKREPLFLSAASPEARELVTKIIGYFAQNYAIDGLLLDYIRYDETINDDDLSKKYFAEEYFQKYQVYPPEALKQSNPIFVEWQLWREKQVTKAVEQIRKAVLFANPELKIGVSVFRSEYEGRLTKMQDWRNWSDNGIVDYITPMLYTDKVNDLDMWLNWETNQNKRADFIYPGLGAHRFGVSEFIFKQIELLHRRNVPGLNIFALTHISNQVFSDLGNGFFRKNALIPHKNIYKSVKTILVDLKEWLQSLQKSGEISQKTEISEIIKEIELTESAINETVPNDFYSLRDLGIKITSLIKSVENSIKENKLPQTLLATINGDLEYALSLFRIEFKKKLNENKDFPQTMPPLPRLTETYELPSVYLEKVPLPPLIDGVSDDDFWANIQPLRKFYWHNGISGAVSETIVKLAYGNDNLYVFFENYETDMDKIINNQKIADSYEIFTDDSIEIFLKDPENPDYYHFVLSAGNLKFEEQGNKIEWNGNWQGNVRHFSDKWVAEIVIPFKEINFEAKVGKSIKANFIRNRPREFNPVSAWSPTFGSSHTPSRFGNIIFN